MAPKRQGREFDPHTDHLFDPFLYFTLFFFFCILQKRSRQREEVEEAYLSLLKESALKLSYVYLQKKRPCTALSTYLKGENVGTQLQVLMITYELFRFG